MAKIVSINTCDIANGKGIRTSVFFSGCEHHCKNCFNKEAWSFDVGEEFTKDYYEQKIKPTISEYVDGLSILGGEALHPVNISSTYLLCKWFKEDFPTKSIWLWTGYTYEELFSEKYELKLNTLDYVDDIHFETLKLVDVLIDGRFVEELKDLRLAWRGSSNQRVIDMKQTIVKGEVVLLE